MNWYNFFVKVSEADPTAYMTIDQLDPDKAYETFRDSYEKSTGKAWNKDKFLSRANGWRFYGDQNGYITVREQGSGMLKMTGIAGSLKSALKGLQNLFQENMPIWGLVSKEISQMAQRVGFESPPVEILRIGMSKIPPSVFGSASLVQINDDGGVVMDYPDVGRVTKYLIGNSQYFARLSSMI